MGPQNAVIGDSFGIDIPQTQVQENDLVAEKSMAKFSKSNEFKKLKEHIESRIAFYQTCLPNGEMVAQSKPTAEDWRVANSIIGEFKAILMSYEEAREAVENANK